MLASVPVMDGGLIALTRFQGEIGFYPEEYLESVRGIFPNTFTAKDGRSVELLFEEEA